MTINRDTDRNSESDSIMLERKIKRTAGLRKCEKETYIDRERERKEDERENARDLLKHY